MSGGQAPHVHIRRILVAAIVGPILLASAVATLLATADTGLSMLSMARDALQRNLILPYYQPKVDLRTDAITGFEALLRWRHEGRGLQLPATIGAAFDDPELALKMGERMQETVVHDIRQWLDRGLQFGRVAINASAAEFRDPRFVSRLLNRLRDANVPPTCIELEVTETVILSHNAEHVQRIISELSGAGVTIALDDFGTGYASLAHLKQFPVDVLKIDRSFVQELADHCDGAIVRAIVCLGRNLGIRTVAEGIETDAQRARLFSKGCSEGQGYLFSPPVPADEVPVLLARMAGICPPRDRRSGTGRRAADRHPVVSGPVSAEKASFVKIIGSSPAVESVTIKLWVADERSPGGKPSSSSMSALLRTAIGNI